MSTADIVGLVREGREEETQERRPGQDLALKRPSGPGVGSDQKGHHQGLAEESRPTEIKVPEGRFRFKAKQNRSLWGL